jgi:hypothetical protein
MWRRQSGQWPMRRRRKGSNPTSFFISWESRSTRQRSFHRRTRCLSGVVVGSDERAYFVGVVSPLGLCITHQTSSLGKPPWTWRSAVCTRTAAKREDCSPRLPSRQQTVCHCSLGNWRADFSMAQRSTPSAS